MALTQLQTQPALIDQVHDLLLAAVVDGTLEPGRRLTQDELAGMLGVSRQPVSHALQLLRRTGLFIDAGKRGVAVAPIDAKRIRDLYRVREALDGLAAELAAARQRSGDLAQRQIAGAVAALDHGIGLPGTAPMADLVDADVAFHTAVYALSGNGALAETVADQWPHFRRSMHVVLATSTTRVRVWTEHKAILDAVLAGDSGAAGRHARAHASSAGEETARRLGGAAAIKDTKSEKGKETP